MSQLAFRMLVRRHDCQWCYSPMLPAKAFLSLPADGPAIDARTGGPATQAAYLTTCAADRPLAVQLGGSDPTEMLAAARLVQDRGIDCVDVNFGCPQQCARTGGYGAFLLDDPEHARSIVEALVDGLRVPVTAKIRIHADVAETVAFATMLEDAGVAAVAVHGRRREQRHHEGAADWEQIRAVKQALRIPVISNGNITTAACVAACLRETGVDCVMSAKGLLADPTLFAVGAAGGSSGGGEGGGGDGGGPTRRAERALEYLECCRLYPEGCLPRMMSEHLLEMLAPDLAHAFNGALKKELAAHRTTTRPAQYESLVRRIAANAAFAAQVEAKRKAEAPSIRPVNVVA